MARYDTRPWRWTSARTCSSISSKFTTPPLPVRILVGTHRRVYGGMVELRAHSSPQGLFQKGTPARTKILYSLRPGKTRGGAGLMAHPFSETPLLEPARYGVHRTYRVSAFQTVPD